MEVDIFNLPCPLLSQVRTHRIGANPKNLSSVSFRGPDLRNIDKMPPKPRFSKLIFGHSAGSTKLDRPYCKRLLSQEKENLVDVSDIFCSGGREGRFRGAREGWVGRFFLKIPGGGGGPSPRRGGLGAEGAGGCLRAIWGGGRFFLSGPKFPPR